MAQQANVESVDAIRQFRAQLFIYVSKARPTLDEAVAEIRRMKVRLQTEKRTHWEQQVRRRTKEMEEAQQNLFSARIASIREATTAEIAAANRAKRALDHAQGKLKLVKKWNRDFDNQFEPLVRQLEKMQTILTNDMAKAAQFLAKAIGTLDAYTDLPGAGEKRPPEPPRPVDDPAVETPKPGGSL